MTQGGISHETCPSGVVWLNIKPCRGFAPGSNPGLGVEHVYNIHLLNGPVAQFGRAPDFYKPIKEIRWSRVQNKCENLVRPIH